MRPGYRGLFESIICLLALTVLPLAALTPALRGESVPMALGGALFEAPWADARPADMTEPASSFESLQMRRYYPWFSVINRAALAGDSVSWNPYEACGVPLLAQWETRALSPFSLFFYFLPLQAALVWSLIAKLIVAGWGTFYLLRRLGIACSMALLAAVAFQLSGPVFFWGPFPLSDVVVWLPLLMLFAERAAIGQLRAWPTGALTIGLMSLGGDPAALVAALLFAAAYVVLRSRGTEGQLSVTTGLMALGAATLGGLALAGVQLLPWLEFRGMAVYTGDSLAARFTPGGLAGLAVPGLVHPENADLRAPGYMLYTGMAPTLLLVLWVAVRRFAHAVLKKRTDILLGLGVVTSFLALLVPRLPGGFGPEHLLMFHGFCLAFVAASATTEWLELNAEQCKAALLRMLVLVPVLWGGGAVLLGLHAAHTGVGGTVRAEVLVAIVAVLAVLALLAVTMFVPRVRLLGYGTAAITAFSLWVVMPAAAPSTPAPLVFPQSDFVAALESANSRIAGSGGLDRWPTAVHGVAQAGNPSGVSTARYAALRDAWQASPLLLRMCGAQSLLLTKEDIRTSFGPLRPLLRIQHIFTTGAVLFNDLEAPARIWLTRQWRPVATSPEPGTLEPGSPPQVETTEAPDANAKAETADTLEQIQQRAGESTIQVKAEQMALLVLMDTWYPGWEVAVDGRRAAPLRVNGTFMGTILEPGEHQVTFEYRPRSHTAGLGLSIAAALCVALGLFSLWRTLWRERTPV